MPELSRELNDADFERFSEHAYRLAGIELNETKRHLVISRLIRRVRSLKLKTLNEYRGYLDANPGQENDHFINAITTNLTYFFREDHHFDYLQEHLRQLALTNPRIWSAGCSTGQEPYSIAISLKQMGLHNASILASDIDTQCLEKGRQGVYRLEDIAEMDEAFTKAYFLRGAGANDGMVRVKESLRNMVTFERVNLMQSLPDEQFDIIFCRNVFIYFDTDTQMRLMQKFADRLKSGGLLFLGHSELLRVPESLFKVVGKTTFLKCHA